MTLQSAFVTPPYTAPAAQATALFVDGENLSQDHAGRILTALGPRGTTRLARVYGDMSRGVWTGATGFRFIHAGSGKNAADLLMCIEAMAAWQTGRYTTFAIATSDRDFSHLALWLREAGATVIGFGEAKAPLALRNACSVWIALTPPVASPPCPAPPPARCVVTQIAAPLTPIEQAALAELALAGGCMRLAALGSSLGNQVRKTDLPEKNWRAFIVARPHLFKVDPVGPDACVRLVQTCSTVTRSLA